MRSRRNTRCSGRTIVPQRYEKRNTTFGLSENKGDNGITSVTFAFQLAPHDIVLEHLLATCGTIDPGVDYLVGLELNTPVVAFFGDSGFEAGYFLIDDFSRCRLSGFGRFVAFGHRLAIGALVVFVPVVFEIAISTPVLSGHVSSPLYPKPLYTHLPSSGVRFPTCTSP